MIYEIETEKIKKISINITDDNLKTISKNKLQKKMVKKLQVTVSIDHLNKLKNNILN